MENISFKLPEEEMNLRIKVFKEKMNERFPEWEMAVIFSMVNLYYFSGTMQDSILIMTKQDDDVLFVRRNFERSLEESLFEKIIPISNYRDAAAYFDVLPKTIYTDTNFVTLDVSKRFAAAFGNEQFESLDAVIADIRSVKSEYELSFIKRSGEIHREVMEEVAPTLFKDGMSEAQLASELFSALVERGHHGVVRFGMFNSEISVGNVCFAESSLWHTSFNGPAGNLGLYPAVPTLGSRDNKLKFGNLIYLDIGCGYGGYHTDKTMTYLFGKEPSNELKNIQELCVALQNRTAELLRPGVKPCDVYWEIVKSPEAASLSNFMGYKDRKAKFIGHSLGLLTDETPVIANGFSEPIQENMVFAIEPKCGVEGVGMLGIENTFLVAADRTYSLTGNHNGLMVIQ